MPTGTKIKEIRKQKGLTQKQLGDLCGIADSNIRKYENGKQNPKIETLQKIADALGCSLITLTGMERYKETDEYKNSMKSIDVYNAVLALLKNIYGEVQEKDVQQEYGESFYYLIGKEPNTFVLYEDDITNLQNYIESSLPIVVDKIKDTRPENVIREEITKDLNDPEYINHIKTIINEQS